MLDLPPPTEIEALDDLPEDDGEYAVDCRENPRYYRVDRGERGVFKVQPYKSELLPLWGYADEETAQESAEAIYERFESYRGRREFPGMDMARKYLQMGYTRSMRYARYPGGQKYMNGEEREPTEWADQEKRDAARVYANYLDRVESDPVYTEMRDAWKTIWG